MNFSKQQNKEKDMGNKYTIEEWIHDGAGYMWRLRWQGESTIATFWLMFKWRKNNCIKLTSRW